LAIFELILIVSDESKSIVVKLPLGKLCLMHSSIVLTQTSSQIISQLAVFEKVKMSNSIY